LSLRFLICEKVLCFLIGLSDKIDLHYDIVSLHRRIAALHHGVVSLHSEALISTFAGIISARIVGKGKKNPSSSLKMTTSDKE